MRMRLSLATYLLAFSQIWVASLSFAQNLPALPNIPDIGCRSTSTVSSATVLRVPAGGNLQQALNTAQPGDTILLDPGATYTSTSGFTFPPKPGAGCITIRSSAPDSSLPPAGERINPSYAPLLPKLVSSTTSVLTFPAGSHHYLIMNVEIYPIGFINDLVWVGTGTENNRNLLPHHIEFDRVYIHGHATQGTKRGIALNGAAVTVKNSYISAIRLNGLDSQAICSWNGSGPFRITNNYLEGAGENVMFGGASPWIQDLVPSDIEIRKNHFFKPLSWRKGDPSYAGQEWTVKNLLEFKNARRVLIYANTFENMWPHAQVGFAILFTPKNDQENCTWCTVEDMTFSSNIIRRASHGVSINAYGWPYPTKQASRILIENNLFLDIGAPFGIGPGRLFQIVATPKDVIIKHNTAFHDGMVAYIEGGSSSGFVFDNNVVNYGQSGFTGAGTSGASMTLSTFFPGYHFQKNVLIGIPSTLQNQYPSSNFFPATTTQVGFANPSSGNYRLTSSSPYKNAGTDGKDPGVDFDLLASAEYTKPLPTAPSPSTPPPATTPPVATTPPPAAATPPPVATTPPPATVTPPPVATTPPPATVTPPPATSTPTNAGDSNTRQVLKRLLQRLQRLLEGLK
ncbi:MAG: hypothetical protein ACREJU_15070 [Nitrospiraceae bacterium]